MKNIRLFWQTATVLLFITSSSVQAGGNVTECDTSKTKPSVLDIVSSGAMALVSYGPLVYACHASKFKKPPVYVEDGPLFGEDSLFTRKERLMGCISLAIYDVAQTIPFVCNLCNYYEGNCSGC